MSTARLGSHNLLSVIIFERTHICAILWYHMVWCVNLVYFVAWYGMVCHVIDLCGIVLFCTMMYGDGDIVAVGRCQVAG